MLLRRRITSGPIGSLMGKDMPTTSIVRMMAMIILERESFDFYKELDATDVMVVVSCWYETAAEEFGDSAIQVHKKEYPGLTS